ncbi:MAG: O-antigen ligase family protein [Cohaesibacter sp.]|nr:O-antigen ligase family protein [Cohaesibacter sp.]
MMWKQTYGGDFVTRPDRTGKGAAFSVPMQNATLMSGSAPKMGILSRPWNQVVVSLVCWFPLWLPFLWLSGLTLFWVLALLCLWSFSWQRWSAIEGAFALTALSLLLGLIMGQVIGFQSDWVMSSIYHLIHWAILLAFMNIALVVGCSDQSEGLLNKLSVASLLSFMLLVFFTISVLVIVKVQPGQIVFPSLVVGRLFPGLDMLSGFMTVTFAQVSPESAGSELRFLGYGLWTSEGAYLAVVLGLLAMMAAYNKVGWSGIVALEIGVLFVVAMTASRTTILAYMLSMGAWTLLMARYWRLAIALSLPLLVAGAIFFLAFGLDYLVLVFNKANELRAASSGTRFASYRLAIEMTMDYNPVTGLGYTPRILEYIHVPIGSHSSWTSIFIRGGFIGLACFAAVYLLLSRDMVRSCAFIYKASSRLPFTRLLPDIVFGRAVFVTLLWWLTEDLDGPAAGVAFSGLVIGLFVGRYSRHGRQWMVANKTVSSSAATPLRWR